MYHVIKMKNNDINIMQTFGKATAEECISKWTQEKRDNVSKIIDVKKSQIPRDRMFRSAWRWSDNDSKIICDLECARSFKLSTIRDDRNNKLAQLDKEAIIAMGSDNKRQLKEIEENKIILRDVTLVADKDLSELKTQEEIKNYCCL